MSNPIRRVYETLGEANETSSDDSFRIYSDPDDIRERFPEDKQQKYFGGLKRRGLVKLIAIERVNEMNVSGTKARMFLQQGFKEAFIQLLPEVVDREAIWEQLSLELEVSK